MSFRWKHRRPPDGCLKNQLMMCIMPQPCVFKESCPNAHSEEELAEWKRRLEYESTCIEQVYIEPETLEECREEIIKKVNDFESSSQMKSVICELFAGFVVLCDENLYTMHLEPGRDLAWIFNVKNTQVKPSKKLERVFFLNNNPYFHMSLCIINTKTAQQTFKLARGVNFWKNDHNLNDIKDIKVYVQFRAEKIGSYGQEVIFDFGGFPKVVKKIGVHVETEDLLTKFMKFDPKKEANNELCWRKMYKIKNFDESKTDEAQEIQYHLPSNIENLVMFDAFKHLDIRLTKSNYRQRLHTLLYIEEYQRRADLQSITFHVDDFAVCLLEAKQPRRGGGITSKTARIEFDESVLEVLTKLVGKSGKALLRVNEYATTSRINAKAVVYEVIVQNITNNTLVLELNAQCFALIKGSPIPVNIDVCFCLIDVFQPMHLAIDYVNLDIIFPSIESSSLPKNLPESRRRPKAHPTKSSDDDNGTYGDQILLSVDQNNAVNVIMDESSPRMLKAPVLLLGPFGAGKTLTIATCVNRILSVKSEGGGGDEAPHKKVLICTHSNSAADHYIEEYFHPRHKLNKDFIDPSIVPLRINWEHRYTTSVTDKVLTYCLQDLNTGLFAYPKKEDLDKHQLIICTLMTSESLRRLHLPEDYFTHVFVDEAAQALEVEAIMPLLLATPKTRIVLAGDHLQMGENLSSLTAKNLGLEKSLLERLFEYYPFDLPCKLKLLENFRSYSEIVQLTSHLFYDDSLICNKTRDVTSPFPVEFHGTDGVEILSKENPSFENVSEAVKIMELVDKMCEDGGGGFNLASICVVAFYPAQVRQIRTVLRQNGFNAVRVESVNNIQGLEFDILLISTVRTYCDLTFTHASLSKDMGFFTNPKLLNTAITRARYRVFLVGDPRALCSVGECKMCWTYIIRYCELYNTFYNGLSYLEVMESIQATKQVKDDIMIKDDILANELQNSNALESLSKLSITGTFPLNKSLVKPLTDSPTEMGKISSEEQLQDTGSSGSSWSLDQQRSPSFPIDESASQFINPPPVANRIPTTTEVSCDGALNLPDELKRSSDGDFSQSDQSSIASSRDSVASISTNSETQLPFLYNKPDLHLTTAFPTHQPIGYVQQTTAFHGKAPISTQVTTGAHWLPTTTPVYHLPIIPTAETFQPTGHHYYPVAGPSAAVIYPNQQAYPGMLIYPNLHYQQAGPNHHQQQQTPINGFINPHYRVITPYQFHMHPRVPSPFQRKPIIKQPTVQLNPQQQLIYTPSFSKSTLRHKIQFLHDYCLHTLNLANANESLKDYIKRSTINAFQDVDGSEGVPHSVASKILHGIELKIEANYTLVHDQLTEFSGFIPDATPHELSKRLVKIEQKLISLKIPSPPNGSEETSETKVCLQFLWKLCCHEVDICRKLEKERDSNVVFLLVKIYFLESKLKDLQLLFEKNSLMIAGEKGDADGRDVATPLTPSLDNDGNDDEVDSWFAKRRDDPCVKEYQAALNRRMAQRLPSPTP